MKPSPKRKESFVPSTNYAYVNGKFVAETEARVSIFDRGFLYGDGVFETLRVYGGRLFRPLAHFDRLFAGLQALAIESPFSPEELRAVGRVLIRQNNVTDGVARFYCTRNSLVVTVQPRRFELREIRAIISRLTIDPQLSRYKTANRLVYLLAQHEAEASGVNDAVLLNPSGRVVELTTSNIFVARAGTLHTPPLSDGPLPGISRQVVLELAGEQGIAVCEESFGPELLAEADEVLATNSLFEVAPVVTWSRSDTLTNRLRRGYQDLVRAELTSGRM